MENYIRDLFVKNVRVKGISNGICGKIIEFDLKIIRSFMKIKMDVVPVVVSLKVLLKETYMSIMIMNQGKYVVFYVLNAILV